MPASSPTCSKLHSKKFVGGDANNSWGDGGNAAFGPLFQTVFIILSWYFRPADRKMKLENQ